LAARDVWPSQDVAEADVAEADVAETDVAETDVAETIVRQCIGKNPQGDFVVCLGAELASADSNDLS
jgi:hypothetical protein